MPDNKNNNREIVVQPLTSQNKKYRIHSVIISEEEFNDKIEELMNQELVYGDQNYY